jgi:hypothetical protein
MITWKASDVEEALSRTSNIDPRKSAKRGHSSGRLGLLGE